MLQAFMFCLLVHSRSIFSILGGHGFPNFQTQLSNGRRMSWCLRLLTASSFPPSLLLRTNDHSLPFNDSLNSCSSLSTLQCLHARILTQGLSHHLALVTKLISLASSLSPSMDYARKLFDSAPYRDSFMWNTLLRGYADSGPCQEVPVLYKQMHGMGLAPDHFTFPFVVRSCAVISALWDGKEVHCNVIKTGFDSNVFLQSALVTMYSQNGEILDSELVFRAMTFRNIVSWTAMIAGYAQNCLFGKAARVFQWMVASGTQPNDVTLVSVLPALKGLECLQSGESIHGYVIKRGLDSHVSLMNALIAMYGKCGSIEVTRFLFNRMPVRSLVSWNTMIAAYEQSGDGIRAMKLFRGMLTERVAFNSVTLVSVISACSSLGALETGKWVHKLAKSRGLESDVRVGNALLNMYAKCGNVDSAREIFEKLSWRGVVSWSAMIGAYASHGHAEMALELFSEMQAEGVKPNTFTFTSVLAACSHSGLVDEGMKHFESMEKDYAINPTVEHCACMVDLLGRAGRLLDAYDLIKRMPMEPDAGVWGALLGACRIHGNIELAEIVADDLFQLGSQNATFYVLMSNMYAEAGRWEDAARLRNMMRELELKKIPGCSLVNTDKRSHYVPSMIEKLACSI